MVGRHYHLKDRRGKRERVVTETFRQRELWDLLGEHSQLRGSVEQMS